jgi:pyridoxine 5-phosphate synthase
VKLFVKLDHICTLRSAGGGREPEPVVAAALAELEGVAGVTLHLHQDRSQVQLRDVQVLKETLSVPLNLELAPSIKNRQHALDLRPEMVTLIQEPRDVRDDRWPLDVADKESVSGFVSAVGDAETKLGIFVKANIDSVRFAQRMKADIVCIDITTLAQAKSGRERDELYERLSDCVRLAGKLGMKVHCGGGVDYRNINLLARLPFDVLHVGHAIVARAIMVGMARAVRDMLSEIEKGRA